LHHLDIERKHRRLLSVEPKIAAFNIMGWGLDIIPIPGEVGANGETALFFVSKDAPIYLAQFKMTTVIAITEPSLGIHQQAGRMLERFSTKVRSIISSFK
jgi:hypothetical protein